MKISIFFTCISIFFVLCFLINISAVFAAQKSAVIVVDMQGDFTTMKGGSLAVAGTDKAFVEKVEETTRKLKEQGYLIFATQDWHPAGHVSFYSNHPGKKPYDIIEIGDRKQVLWPVHCVQNTENVNILIDNSLFDAVVKKGQDERYDSYSGFQDDGGARTELNEILQKHGVKEVIVYGIATDYCVKATALDAVDAGYRVTVMEDLCKGVAPDSTAEALQEVKAKGIVVRVTGMK